MRVIRKEIAKIFNFRLLLILIGFAVIFGYLFLNWKLYPGYRANSPYDVPFYEELVAEFGPTLSKDEYDDFIQKRETLTVQVQAEILSSEVFRKYGVETYEQFEEYHNKSGEVTEEERPILDEINNFWFRNEETASLLFGIQVVEQYIRDNGRSYFVEESGLANWSEYFSYHSSETVERLQTLFQRNEISLLPYSAYQLINDDFLGLVILAVVCCFVLVIFFQITERLRGIFPIATSAKIGRRIFRQQMLASIASGAILGAAIGCVYGVMLWSKNVFVFWDCPLSGRLLHVWLDITFGQYLLLCFFLLVVVSAVAALLAYCIGRVSANYIAGIAISIPFAVGYCVLVRLFENRMLQVGEIERFYAESLAGSLLWTFGGLALLVVAIGIASGALLKRDGRRDIL